MRSEARPESLDDLLAQAVAIKERIESLEKELASILGTRAAKPAPAKPDRKRISAAGIARIRAAQKARWAKLKAAKPAPAVAHRKKFTMSAAGTRPGW
jgi:hypothetical protein